MSIKVPKNSIIKKSFLSVMDKSVALWKKMDVHSSSNTTLEFLSFLYEPGYFEKIKKITEFENLYDNVQSKTTYFNDLFFPREAIEKALRDYVLVAGRSNHDSGDYYKEPAGKDEAIRLLLEDVYLQIPPNRGFVWISGILPQKTVIKVDERTRIRRATRFELRALEQDSQRYWGWDIPKRALLQYPHASVKSVYMIEVKNDPDSLPIIPSIPRKPRDTKVVEHLLSCFRLLWDSPFGLYPSFFSIQTEPHHGYSKELIRPDCGLSLGVMSLIDGDEDLNYRNRPKLVFDRSEQKHLINFWKNYIQFLDSSRSEIQRDFERALLRYNQSYTELYFEDVTLDLALALETITRTGGKFAAYLAAILAAPISDITAIQEKISEFIKLRNRVAHGTTLSISDINLVKRTEEIVRTCLRNVVHLYPHIMKKKQDFRSILNDCLVNCSVRDEIVDKIPKWSRIQK